MQTITEVKKMQEALQRSDEKLRIQNRITEIFLTTPDQEMYKAILQVILEALKSKYGIFGYVDENGALVVPSMTRDIWEKCNVIDKSIVFPKETWGDSIWSRAIREKKLLYFNELSLKTPEGHIPIYRNISLPIIHRGTVIGLLEVANKETDYAEYDFQLLETIGNSLAPILNARLQRDREMKARRKAEEHYATVIQTAIDGFWITDLGGHFLDVNDSYCQMVGYTCEELLTMSISDIEASEQPEETAQHIKKLIKRGYDRFETRHRRKDGKIIDLEISAKYSDVDGGQLIVFIRDITEQKRAVKGLENMFNLSLDLICIVGLDGYFKRINPMFNQMLGYTEGEMFSAPFFEFIHPDDRDATLAELEKLSKGEKIFSFSNRYQCKAGTYRWIEWNAIAVPEEGLIYAIGHDITERKRMERLLLIQRDLALNISTIDKFSEALQIFLNTSLEGAGLDCGGIYLADEKTGALNLVTSKGLSESFIQAAKHFPPESPNVQLVNSRKTLYLSYDKLPVPTSEAEKKEALKTIMLIPLIYQNQVLGCVNVSSHILEEISEETRRFIEGLVGQLGMTISRFRLDAEKTKAQLELQKAHDGLEKRVEERTKELQASEVKFRNMILNLDEAFYNTSMIGILLDYNPAFNKILGFDEEENLIGTKLPDFWQNPEDRNAYLQELLKNGVIRNYNIYAKKKNGEKIIVQANSHFVRDDKGVPLRIEGTFLDVTKQKQAEEALRKSEAKFRNIFESNMIGIIFWDRDGNLLDANEAFLQMVRYTREEILSGTVRWRDMTPPEYTHLDDMALEEMAIKGVSAPFEKEYIRKDGNHVPILIGAAILEGDQSMGIAFVLDITKRKQAEVELQKTSENLARSNSELQQFAYVASHDLQEPLRMVASYMQLLERRYKDKLDNDAQEFIAYAVDGATRMKTLINDLLQYSRIETRANPLELTDMENVLNQTISNLEMALKENTAVITHDTLPHIIADSTQMVQLLQNLIDNGIKFHSDKLPQIHIGTKQNEKEWVFSVRDNGIGIDPQYFNRLFIIFQRLHSRDEYPGTGIGLAVCKRIVARHGGQIWVESEVGEGATFYFTIPIRRGESKKEK